MENWLQAGDFALVVGEPSSARIIDDAWDVYAGVRTDNGLARLITTDKVHGCPYFVNDSYWWQYVDSQCNFHGTYGWRPFFDPSYRRIDYHTWNRFFECQVDAGLQKEFLSQSKLRKTPPVGFFPHSVFPEKEASELLTLFYSNCFAPGDEAHERHDEQIDYQLLNIISATDWLLFERNSDIASRILNQVEIFIQVLENRMSPDGLLLVGPQGSQAEFSHGGWRYPSSTFVYLLKACRNLAQVAGMVEDAQEPADAREEQAECRERWEERERRLATHLDAFLQDGKWFVGGLTRSRTGHFGTGLLDASPSSYFETFPNLNSVVLGVASSQLAGSILDRMDGIPPLTKNKLVLNNYPARPVSEMDDDHNGFPPPGVHMNGGSWWMLASGMMYAWATAGRPGTCRYVDELLQLHRAHLTIDYYNNWGEDPASQWADKKDGAADHSSIGASGAFGMFLRGMLGIVPLRDGLKIMPRLPEGVVRMRTVAPVYYGGKELFFEISQRSALNPGGLDHGPEKFLSYSALPDKTTITVDF